MSDDQEFFDLKRITFFFVGLAIIVSIGVWWFNKAEDVVEAGIVTYEEFHEINGTCKQLHADLCNMQERDAADPSFEQFSKADRVYAIEQKLNHWIETYNAKSKMITKELWKDDSLPQTLSADSFSCN